MKGLEYEKKHMDRIRDRSSACDESGWMCKSKSRDNYKGTDGNRHGNRYDGRHGNRYDGRYGNSDGGTDGRTGKHTDGTADGRDGLP